MLNLLSEKTHTYITSYLYKNKIKSKIAKKKCFLSFVKIIRSG